MALAPVDPSVNAKSDGSRSYLVPFMLVTSLFFLWGVANSLNGTLIKHFQTALHLTRGQAGIVDSAFYIGYFVMAIPAGFILNRIGYKKGIILGLSMFALGAVLFFPSAEYRVYGFFLASLFIIACGLGILETAANPYVSILGDPATAVSRINFAQSFNGLGAVLGPIIGGLFIFSSVEYTNEILATMPPEQALNIRIEEAHSVQMPYLALAAVVVCVILGFTAVTMPEPSSPSESGATMKGIFRHRHLVWGVVAQFFYVGGQAALWGYIVDLKLFFARDEHLKIVEWIYQTTGDMTPTQIASYHASFGFIMFMVGRFFGTWLLSKFDAARLLSVYAIICLSLMGFAWLSTGIPAVAALLLTYFFMSIMFPTIFSLSIRNLGHQVKLGASLVIMSIVGGAILPPIAGWISQTGVQNALIVPWIGFLFILYFGWKGYKVKSV